MTHKALYNIKCFLTHANDAMMHMLLWTCWCVGTYMYTFC